MKDTIRRMQRFASTPFRAVVIITAILFVVGWLMGYLRPLDAFLGVELPAWVQVLGIIAVVAGAALAQEPGLEKRFGDSYREYRRNVRRWLPRITPWQRSSAEPGAAADGGRDPGFSEFDTSQRGRRC